MLRSGAWTPYKDDKRMRGLGSGFMEFIAYTELGAHCVPSARLRGRRPRRVPAQPERAPPRSRSPASFVKPGAGFRAGRFDPAERKASKPETSAVKNC